jgi:hypothetical protein
LPRISGLSKLKMLALMSVVSVSIAGCTQTQPSLTNSDHISSRNEAAPMLAQSFYFPGF